MLPIDSHLFDGFVEFVLVFWADVHLHALRAIHGVIEVLRGCFWIV